MCRNLYEPTGCGKHSEEMHLSCCTIHDPWPFIDLLSQMYRHANNIVGLWICILYLFILDV